MVKQLEIEAVVFVVIGAVVGSFLVGYVKSNSVQPFSHAAMISVPQFTQTATTVPSPLPSPTPIVSIAPVTTTTSQPSPDGNQKITMKITSSQNRQTYEITTDGIQEPIFTQTLNEGETISIPFNTFSPDNHYFFIHEQTNAGEKVLVFKTTGEAFADGVPYLDLTDAYTKYGSGNTFDAATGWAGYEIIVINTKLSDGSQGPSYWFEVPSGGILPLSTKF